MRHESPRWLFWKHYLAQTATALIVGSLSYYLLHPWLGNLVRDAICNHISGAC